MKHTHSTSVGTAIVTALTLAFAAGHAQAQEAVYGLTSPNNLQVFATSQGERVKWNDRSNNETGFEIIRQKYVSYHWQNTTTLTAPANATSIIDPVAQGVYRYKVRATSLSSNSKFTSWRVAIVPASSGSGGGTTTPTAPAAPSGLAVVDGGGGHATLSWTDNANNETGYRIERNPAFTNPVSLSSNTVSFDDVPNNGTFSYRVVAFNGVGSSAYTPWVAVSVTSATPPTTTTTGGTSGSGTTGTSGSTGGTTTGPTGTSGTSGTTGSTGGTTTGPTGPSGGTGGTTTPDPAWTVFTPSPDSRIVYVSSSTGNDGNDGLSEATAKRSISAGYSLLRSGMPDWLLLKSGDNWNESFPGWSKTGRSSTEKMRVGSYGPGERPIIYCGNGGGFSAGQFSSTVKAHLALTDMHFIAQGNTGTNSSAGVQFLGSWSDVLLENCKVERFHTNIVFQADRTIQTMQDITIRRCVVADAFTSLSSHAEGAYIAGVNRLLLEECVFDHNGWNPSVPGATPTIFRHNIYIQGHAGNYDDCTNVTTRGLIASRGAATGMQQRPGGLAEDHLFLKNPLNFVFGTEGGIVRNCVVLDSRDIDSSNPRGVGFNLVNATTGASTRVQNCIAMYRTVPGTWNIYAYAADQAPNVTLENCISWNWKDAQGHGQAVSANNCPMPTVVGGNMEQTPPQSLRSIETYMTSLGMTPSVDAFLAEARKQSRNYWRPEFTAKAVNNYIRAGWGMSTGQ